MGWKKAQVQRYPSGNGYRWRLIGANGEKVIPPEVHPTKSNVARAVRRAAKLLATAEIVDVPARMPKSIGRTSPPGDVDPSDYGTLFKRSRRR